MYQDDCQADNSDNVQHYDDKATAQPIDQSFPPVAPHKKHKDKYLHHLLNARAVMDDCH
jgi:hypothetical protein